MSGLENLIANYYRIRNNNMDREKYDKMLLLYKKIRTHENNYINLEVWNSIYIRSKNVIPETPPNKKNILEIIKNNININYLDLIKKFYNLIDKTSNIKKLSPNIVNELNFTIFILSKLENIHFKINNSVWENIRQKCLIKKTKTKMPREPVTLQEIIQQINNIININNI